MSVKVMAWVFEHSQSTLADRLVLLAIADHANHDGLDAYPSVDTIARKAGVSRATVFRAIDRLVELGELTVESRRGRGNTSRYQINAKTSQDETFGNGRRMRPLAPEKVSSTHEKGLIHGPEKVSLVRPEPKENRPEPSRARARAVLDVREALAKTVPTATYGGRRAAP